MKVKFSRSWKRSKQPRKQRKYMHNAPLHARARIMSCNLDKSLREKYGRSVRVRKGNKAKVMRGQFKGVVAKVDRIDRRNYKVFLEGVFVEKKDGTKVPYPIHYSNLQLVELDLSDSKRFKAEAEAK